MKIRASVFLCKDISHAGRITVVLFFLGAATAQ